MEFIKVKKIWDKGTHNAFTDLIRFGDYLYCTFREANEHMSMDGKLRVIRSKKGKKWTSVALMDFDGGDVRDGKFSITAKNELMLNAGVRLIEPIDGNKTSSVTWLSSDGKNWSDVFICDTGLGTWRWSTTWNNQKAYSIGYSGKDKKGCLYSSKNGKKWQIVKDRLFPFTNSYCNESSLVFTEDDTMYCLLRRDSQSYSSFLGVSKFPYDSWDWSDLGVACGGPKMIYLKEQKRFIAVVRLYGNKSARTSICYIDEKKGELQEVMSLPSGGDTSYAGVVEKNGVLWISYYSSHDENSSIYLAKVRL